MKKFLILGGDSLLAKYFLQSYGKDCLALNKEKCNIADQQSLDRAIKKTGIKYVLNCAAITDIEYSEKNPLSCFQTNTIAVHNMDSLCRKYNRKLIHISSDYAVNPINIYGYSKFISEKVIDLNKSLVIRTSFYSPKFYIIKSLMLKHITYVYKNMFFNPVSINRIVAEIYKNRDRKGILNIFSERKISKYNFARMVAKILNLNSQIIKPLYWINEPECLQLPLNSFVKSDIKIPLVKDFLTFKKVFNVPFGH